MFVIFLGCRGVVHLGLVLFGFKKIIIFLPFIVLDYERGGKEKCPIHREE